MTPWHPSFDFNRYVYANDNPVRNTDPDGRQTLWDNSPVVLENRWNDPAVAAGELQSSQMAAAFATAAAKDYVQSISRDGPGAVLAGVGGAVVSGVRAAEGITKGVKAVETAATAGKDATYLYQKVGAQGEHLKFGITKNPATRYTKKELGGGKLRILRQGKRTDMLRLERKLHETMPIGSEERQLFYTEKQIEKGLKPPPYNP